MAVEKAVATLRGSDRVQLLGFAIEQLHSSGLLSGKEIHLEMKNPVESGVFHVK